MKALSISCLSLAILILSGWSQQPDRTATAESEGPKEASQTQDSVIEAAEDAATSIPEPEPDKSAAAPPDPAGAEPSLIPSEEHEAEQLAAPSNAAPEADTDNLTPRIFWECRLPGGGVTLDISDIVTVSHHEYVIHDEARVYEVTIVTRSPVVTRFYYWDPLPMSSRSAPAPLAEGQVALERLRDSAATGRYVSRDGEPKGGLPVKRAEDVALAPSIEYRLEKKADVEALYRSVQASWKNSEHGVFRLEEE